MYLVKAESCTALNKWWFVIYLCGLSLSGFTDLYIYILDTVHPVHVVCNHVGTDKLTTANGGTFTSISARLSSQSRQSTSVTDRACCNVIGYWISGWARSKRSAICIGKLCGGFIIFEQCCPCECVSQDLFRRDTTLCHLTSCGQFMRHLKAHLFRAQESWHIRYFFAPYHWAVASLWLVSPGAESDGCHLFPFSFLVIASESDDFYSCRLLTTPIFPHRLSSVLSQFSHKSNFRSGVTPGPPWWCHPGRFPSDATAPYKYSYLLSCIMNEWMIDWFCSFHILFHRFYYTRLQWPSDLSVVNKGLRWGRWLKSRQFFKGKNGVILGLCDSDSNLSYATTVWFDGMNEWMNEPGAVLRWGRRGIAPKLDPCPNVLVTSAVCSTKTFKQLGGGVFEGSEWFSQQCGICFEGDDQKRSTFFTLTPNIFP